MSANLQAKKGKWTDAQWDAITTVGRSVLVSAAAGSGKTAVLSERCAHLVCDASPACGVDELLVVTFTETAAAEMKSRIQQALAKRLESDPTSTRLARQVALVEHAQISTLHGFCSRLLRQHFNVIGLDPNFIILDGDEGDLLRREVLQALFHESYEHDETGQFQRLIDSYGEGDDGRLMSRIDHTYRLLCSLIDPDRWRQTALVRLTEAAEKPLTESSLGQQLLQTIGAELADLKGRCKLAGEQIKAFGAFDPYIQQLRDLYKVVDHWESVLKSDGPDALAEEFNGMEMPKAPRTASNLPNKEQAKEALDAVKDSFKAGRLTKLLGCSSAQWLEGLSQIVPHSEIFLKLVDEFSTRYQKAKADLRGLDFNDLERFAFKVLCDDPSTLSPSAVARVCHDQFQHVLVDEYQDINELQDAILSLVSRECLKDVNRANFFCVGDVKQSIFRFRLAEPQRFLDRQSRFRRPAEPGKVIDLQSNFRSRGPLLEAINSVFERLMTHDAAEIEYDQSHRLHPGAQFDPTQVPTFTGAPMELHLLPKPPTGAADPDADAETPDLDKTDYEAMLIARRIREMMGFDGSPRMHVMDKDPAGQRVPRPIRYGDMVILLRTLRVKGEQFADILRQAGIPVHCDGGTGFFTAMEIRDMLSLLKLLDNQQQDIPLAAYLRSPLAGLPHADDSLARIRLAYDARGEGAGGRGQKETVAFHHAVVRYSKEHDDELAARLRDVLRQLSDWRELAHKRPLAELIWTIYKQSGFLTFCAGLSDGEQRTANLINLHERARQFGSFLRQGLYRFLRFLEGLEEEKDLGRPSVASEADDAVHIMSVHRSKGLEFPVVFLPDLGKKHNMEDTRGSILVDRCAFLGLAVVDETLRIVYPSLASLLVSERIRRQTLAEELRLLYVALTRAKEHLILLGTVPADSEQKWRSSWSNHCGPLPRESILSAVTPLDWIGPIVGATVSQPNPPFEVRSYTEEDLRSWPDPKELRPRFTPQQEQLAHLVPLTPAPAEDKSAQRVIERLNTQYAHRPYSMLAAAQSVSAWTKHGKSVPMGYEDSEQPAQPFETELPAPRCLSSERKMSAADLGTLTHLVLEHLDFARTCDAADVAAQIDQLIARRLISQADANLVDRDGIVWMMNSELGQILRRHATQVLRELPIYVAVPPAAFDAKLTSTDPMDHVMIRGRLDVLIPTPAGLILVDYKTDRVTPQTLPARAEFYRGQMDCYRQALQSITPQPILAIHLVFLSPRLIHTL